MLYTNAALTRPLPTSVAPNGVGPMAERPHCSAGVAHAGPHGSFHVRFRAIVQLPGCDIRQPWRACTCRQGPHEVHAKQEQNPPRAILRAGRISNLGYTARGHPVARALTPGRAHPRRRPGNRAGCWRHPKQRRERWGPGSRQPARSRPAGPGHQSREFRRSREPQRM